MEQSAKEEQMNKQLTKVTTYSIPFPIGDIKENLSISTNTPSKTEIINKAFKFHSQGNILNATKYYKYFINQGFKDHKVFCNYGVILKDLGKLEEAELSTRKAIEINPNFAEAYANLGNILKGLGKLQEAELSTRKAIEINPNFANAYNNLGNILGEIGKLQEAELSTRKAIEINPNFAEAHANLGNILKNLGKLQEAEFYIRKAIKLNPNFANAYNNLGNIFREIGKLQEAELSTRKAIEINPNVAITHANLGIILRDLGKPEEAELSLKKAIEINPNFTNAYFNLFHHYEKTNNLKQLKDSLKEFKNINNIENELLLFGSRLCFRNKDYTTSQKLINSISTKWIEKSNHSEKILFWSYKAFIEDKVGNFDIAYSCFEKSQDESSYARFSQDSYLNLIDSYKESIINKTRNINQFNDDIEDINLTFLIGFPRSGTTLLDTILRSHPDIEVIEEKPLISTIEKIIEERFKTKIENIFNISEDNIMILRQKYFELLMEYKNKDASLIIDKLPLNTVSLPLINLLFPKAKIIFTHRHPYDTILSCFQQSFKPNEAMANLISLKSSSRMYDQVMIAWDIYKNNLPLKYITSKYENLINNFDSHILTVLNFLGVGWDENVKSYRKTALERKKINTPSSSQVIQPLYKSSIKKWKNYEKYFEDCHQYLEKWISYFDY